MAQGVGHPARSKRWQFELAVAPQAWVCGIIGMHRPRCDSVTDSLASASERLGQELERLEEPLRSQSEAAEDGESRRSPRLSALRVAVVEGGGKVAS